MKSLINKGFNEETLNELKKICVKEFDTDPTLYFLLHSIFSEIETAFGNQGMRVELYDKYFSLAPYINNVLSKKDISSLDNLIKSFVQIQPLD